VILPRHSAPRGLAAGSGAVVVACLLLLPLRDDLTIVVPPLVLVLPVLLAAVAGGRQAAVGMALLATLATNVVFTPPFGSLKVEVASDAVALAVFLVVALAVGTLVASLVTRTEAAEQRRDETSRILDQLQEVMAERERLAVEASRVEALVEVDEQRRALLRSVSHDLRTPLATIRAVASDLADATAHDTATRVELLELVSEEADRLDRLVANLLSLSRIEAGAFAPEHQAIDVGELVQERVRRLSRLFRQVRLQVTTPEEPVVVEGDHSQLQQVVTNLLENAARYAPAASTLSVAVEATPSGVRITVADEGPGVPEWERERIFEPFRAAGTTGRGTASSGIGLAICKSIVEAHGGTIAACRTPGGGATFHVTLPEATPRL
jgi:K+-sensing histidine kinase KdpD